MRICGYPQCRANFFVCVSCDRGQRYCSQECRAVVRCRQRREANPICKANEANNLRDRQRRRERQVQACVTDQGGGRSTRRRLGAHLPSADPLQPLDFPPKPVGVTGGRSAKSKVRSQLEADVATTTQLGVLQPLKRKESPFQLSQFAQREGQAVLPGIGRELAQDH